MRKEIRCRRKLRNFYEFLVNDKHYKVSLVSFEEKS